jgi:hypothetical protein
MDRLSVSKHPRNRGKNTRNDKSSHGRIEATALSRMVKALDRSDKRARIECGYAKSDKKTGRCVCAQCVLKLLASEDILNDCSYPKANLFVKINEQTDKIQINCLER